MNTSETKMEELREENRILLEQNKQLLAEMEKMLEQNKQILAEMEKMVPVERVGATPGLLPRGIPRINECTGHCKGWRTCTCAEEEEKRYAEAKTCKTCGLADFICYRRNYGRCG